MATLTAINPLWYLVTYKFPHWIISKSPICHPPRAVIRQNTWHSELLSNTHPIMLLGFPPISLDWDFQNTVHRQWLWIDEYLLSEWIRDEWMNDWMNERIALLSLHTMSACGWQQVLSGKREKVESCDRCALWRSQLLRSRMVIRTVPEQVSQALAAQSALLLLSYVVSSKSLNLSVPVAGRFAMR